MSLELNKRMFTFNFTGLVAAVETIITMCVVCAIFTDTAAQTPEDSASVSEFVEAYQHTFNTHDPSALAAFFTEDADFLMFNLPEIQGRQDIENWWRDYWQSKFNKQELGRKGTFNLNSVRFLADDVALVNIETITGGKDSLGVKLKTREARGSWLLNRKNENWLISAICGMPTEKDSVVLTGSTATARLLRPNIRAFVDAYEDAFNSHDPSAVTAFFQNDADIIVRNRPLINGTQAIKKWWRDYFSSPRAYRAILIIDKIRTIRDDVIQVNVIGTGAVPEAKDKLQPVRQTNAMWILVHKDSKWLIAALRVLPGKDDRIIRESDN